MNRMLINATQAEELRVAIVNGQMLYDLDIEHVGREQKKSNIYKGRISRIEPSLEAVFVDYGSERHGFLPFKEIAPEYLKSSSSNEYQSVREALKVGQELMIQIEKEERGNKGAALTTYISLPGCYLVLMPNNPGAGGISRRIEGDDRADMRDTLSALGVPEDMGLIVRTAGVGRNPDELQWDLTVLLKLWAAIQQAYQERPAPFLIHQESDVIMRAIRDYLRKDIGEIIVDDAEVFEQAKQRVELMRPDFINSVKLYKDTVPLFSRYQIEHQIESVFQREVRLPSGSTIVIDHTEALVSIDINSGRATKGGDIEETALNTNLEAAEEIARQLRLRDIGGLIVIDFIDMSAMRNQREVENRLRDALKMDRARIQLGRISRFGLMEMSRQRLRASLGDSTQVNCPRCTGQGRIRGVESLALSIMRIIEEDAIKDKTTHIQAQVPIEVATYLVNEKRKGLAQIEQRHNVTILIIPNKYLETPQYKIMRLRAGESADGLVEASYTLATRPEESTMAAVTQTSAAEQPAVKNIHVTATPPIKQVAKPSMLSRLLGTLFGKSDSKKTTAVRKPVQATTTQDRSTSTQQRPRHMQQQERRGGHHHSRHGQNRGRRQQGAQQGAQQGGNRPQKGERNQGNFRNRPDRPERDQFAKSVQSDKPVDTRTQSPTQAMGNVVPKREAVENVNRPAQQQQNMPVQQQLRAFDTPAADKVVANEVRPSANQPIAAAEKPAPVHTDSSVIPVVFEKPAHESQSVVPPMPTATPQPPRAGGKRNVHRFGGAYSRRRGYLRTAGGKSEAEGGEKK